MDLDTVIYIFAYFANVVMMPETKLQYFDIYLHNKNILEYAQIEGIGPRFIIFDIEGHSRIYDNISDLGYNCIYQINKLYVLCRT